MMRRSILFAIAILCGSCATPTPTPSVPTSPAPSAANTSVAETSPPPSVTVPVPTSSYRPIEVTAAMKAGITSSRGFELVYALDYATNHADKSVPEAFGGLSSMLFGRQSDGVVQFEIVSDQGQLGILDVPDAMSARAQLSGVSGAVFLPMRGPDGAVLSGGNNVDSEGLARIPNGRLVSLERNHRLLRITGGAISADQVTTAGPNLIGFEGLEPNGGMEALVALPDGRFLASAEYGRGDQGPDAKFKAPYWIFGGDQAGPIAPAGTFQNSGGYGVTEARVMDNDLWLLKREYDFTTKINKARLERCPLASVIAGAPVCTLELALEPPFVMDNYEGMEIFKQAGTGDLYFYIMSDDNFSATQRTIVLAFKVPG